MKDGLVLIQEQAMACEEVQDDMEPSVQLLRSISADDGVIDVGTSPVPIRGQD
jgi:hypothetical protein